jgi:transposase
MGRQWERKRRHTAEFKREAVRLMKERVASGVTLKRVSEELDIGADLLRVWGHQVDDSPDGATADQIFPGHGHKRTIEKRVASGPARTLTLEEEVERLRRECERLRQERDFLKKAAAFFAKESR